jgi:hypothetical protein
VTFFIGQIIPEMSLSNFRLFKVLTINTFKKFVYCFNKGIIPDFVKRLINVFLIWEKSKKNFFGKCFKIRRKSCSGAIKNK